MADLYSFIVYNVEQDLTEVKRFTIGPSVKSDLLITLANIDGMKVINRGTVYMKFPFMFCVELYVPDCVSEDHVMSYVESLYQPKDSVVTNETLKETFRAMKDAVEKANEIKKKDEDAEYQKKWDEIVKDIFDSWEQFDKLERTGTWPRKFPWVYPYGY